MKQYLFGLCIKYYYHVVFDLETSNFIECFSFAVQYATLNLSLAHIEQESLVVLSR